MATIKGGDKLDAALERIAKIAGQRGVVKVGFLEGAKYPDGTNVAQVAFWNEYGTLGDDGQEHVPPRPFFRTMIEEKTPGWAVAVAKNAKANNYDIEIVLNSLGERIKDQLVGSINGWTLPPNADYTVAKKGFNKPLIDTADMLRSPDYVVEMGKTGE